MYIYYFFTILTGPIDSCAIDLARIMTSKLLLNRLDYVSVFINSGASPNGIAGNVTPIAAALRASQLPRRRQVDIVSILLDNGADIKNLSSAYQDPMSPVHVATKLALETGLTAYMSHKSQYVHIYFIKTKRFSKLTNLDL